MSSLKDRLREARTRTLKPRPTLTLPQWADAKRYLSSMSSEAGKWRTDRIAVARGPMEAATDPKTRRLSVMGPTQLLKTELILNVIGYYIDQDPCPILVMQPGDDEAEAFIKERVDPMIECTPVLKKLVKEKKSRDSGNTVSYKSYPGGFLVAVGSRSPAKAASRPIRVVLLDEIDKYPANTGREGDIREIVAKRQSTFWNSILIEVCSPTEEETSKIAASYEESDKRIYEVPCLKCGVKQELVWEQVKWPKDQPHLAKYECKQCYHKWNDAERNRAVKLGEWRATAPFMGHAGFRTNCLVSPWETLGKIAVEYVKATKSVEKLQVFVNTRLAKTWKHQADVPDWRQLYDRREEYQRNIVPPEAYFLTAGVDVQGDRLELEIVAWGPRKVSWSIDYRVIYGDPNVEETWEELEKVLDEEWKVAGEMNGTVGISMMAVDSSDNTQTVYDWCRRFKERVMAIKGSGTLDTALGLAKYQDVKKDGKRIKAGIRLWPLGVNIIKKQIYGWLRKPKPMDDEQDPIGYMHFPKYDEHYFKMLTAERIVTRMVKGYSKEEWEKFRDRNEALDCRVYARAAATRLGLDRKKEDRLKGLARKHSANKKPVSAPPSADTEDAAPKKQRRKRKRTRSGGGWL